jgi:hypothetical protein
MTKERLKDALVALSLANMVMLGAWRYVWIFMLNPANHYHFLRPPRSEIVLATVVATFLFAATLFLLGEYARAKRGAPAVKHSAQVAVVGLLALGLNSVRQLSPALGLGSRYSLLVIVAAAFGCILLLTTRRTYLTIDWLSLACMRIALAVAPFALLTVASSFLYLSHPEPLAHYQPQVPAPRTGLAQDAIRVLFVVFDELDEDLLSTHRPADLATPSFDALLTRATSWQNAYPAANTTIVSMPALICGRPFIAAERVGANDLLLQDSEAQDRILWSKADSIFTRARQLGVDSALVGWYHPYCRVLGHQVVSCAWFPYSPPVDSLRRQSRGLMKAIVDVVPGIYRIRGGRAVTYGQLQGVLEPGWHARTYRQLHARALEALRGPYRLVFVHYPIPHPPFIYDRHKAAIGSFSSGDYIDNVALADRALGELIGEIARIGDEGRTAIVVTADHGLRRPGWESRGESLPTLGNPLHRVPLMVKLPGQTQGAVRNETISTVSVQAAVLEILRGAVTNGDALSRLLARHR